MGVESDSDREGGVGGADRKRQRRGVGGGAYKKRQRRVVQIYSDREGGGCI